MPIKGMTPLPIELLVPRDELRAQTAREGSQSGRRSGSLSSRGGSRGGDGSVSHRSAGSFTARDTHKRQGSARRPRTSAMPKSAPPPTSPYYGPPMTPRHVLLAMAQQQRSKTAGTGGRGGGGGGGPQGTTPRGERTPRKQPWKMMRESEIIKYFDPNLNGRDILFAYVKADKERAREIGRPGTSGSNAPDLPPGPSRGRTAPHKLVPNVWDESTAGRRKNQAFDPLLHKEQLHRAYMREQLGPSFAGKRTDRVVSEVINSYRDLGGSELRAALKKAAVSDILEAVVDESCIYDMTWYNTSDRALWYFPRALLALRRWEAFSACMCNLHFIVEHSMEFSVPSIIDVLTSGIDEQTSDMRNSAAFTREEIRIKQSQRAALCSEYLSFVQQHAAQLARHPHTAFQLALRHTPGHVRREAEAAVDDFRNLVTMSARSLPVTDPTLLLSLQRAAINAQNHGLDMCLNEEELHSLQRMADEVRDALLQYRINNPGVEAMQDIADVLVGISGGGVGSDEWKRKRNEGFNDVILACETDYPIEIQTSVAYAIVTFTRRPMASDDAIVDSISRCCDVPRASLTVMHRYGSNAVVRVSANLEAEGDGADDNFPRKPTGVGGLEESAVSARNRIMEMAGDSGSGLRKERIVTGLGMRSGRWESMNLYLSGEVDDSKVERDYLVSYVLPAIRARCRTRRIDFSWTNMGEALPNQGGDSRVDMLSKRMQALQLSGISPPGGHRRPFSLSILTERGGYFAGYDAEDTRGVEIMSNAAAKRGFEWISDSNNSLMSVAQLEMNAAFLRSTKDSESFFLKRDHAWTKDDKFKSQVPDIVRDSYTEADPELAKRVEAFNNEVMRKAIPIGRLAVYKPSFHSYELPRSLQEGKYGHTHVSVNSDFWREVHERSEEVLMAMKGADVDGKGTLLKAEIRAALETVDLSRLISDEELGKLTSAHDDERKGHVDYAGMVESLSEIGTVKFGGLAEFGMKAYASVWAIIDSYFPERAPPGGRSEQEINDQEIILDVHANTMSQGVHAHLLKLLAEGVGPGQPIAAVALGGDPGSGKSTLMGAFARQCMSRPGCGAVLYFCFQPWHSVEDMFTCLVAQLDHSILRHAHTSGVAVGGDALLHALSQHATASDEGCVIIVDGLRDPRSELLLLDVIRSHNVDQGHKRVSLVFTTLNIEVKDTNIILAHSLLPLMPSERIILIQAQCVRHNLTMHRGAIEQLAAKRGAGNPKFISTVVGFLAKLEESMTDVESLSHLADDFDQLLIFNVLPFLEQAYGPAFRRILTLVHYEPSGVLTGELPSLVPGADPSEVMSICLDMRDLGMLAPTANVQLLLMSCSAVGSACGRWLESTHVHTKRMGDSLNSSTAWGGNESRQRSPLYGALLHKTRRYAPQDTADRYLDDGEANADDQSEVGGSEAEEVVVDLENMNLKLIPTDVMSKEKAQSVSRLLLSSNQLTFLGRTFVNFSSLTVLTAAVNCFTKLPAELVTATTLKELNLSENQIVSVPERSPLSTLHNLEVLRMGMNSIQNLPDDFGNLSSLKELHLSSNRLLTLPSTVQFLVDLEVLDLSSNKVIEIPSIHNMRKLRRLYLSHNRLTLLPSIERLTNLQDLDFESNEVTSMPSMAEQHPFLTNLNVANNKLGHIDGLISCCCLEHFNASGNRLEDIPGEAMYLTGLKSLRMAGNFIRVLSPQLLVWDRLKTLDLSHNQLQALPPEIGSLSSLLNLNLSGNKLSSLPPEVVECKSLTRVDFEGNPLNLDMASVAATQNKVAKLCVLNGGVLRAVVSKKNTYLGSDEEGEMDASFEAVGDSLLVSPGKGTVDSPPAAPG